MRLNNDMRNQSGKWAQAASLALDRHSAVRSSWLRSRAGFSAIELFVIIGCVTLVVAVLLPFLAKSKSRSSKLNCTNNMKQIGLAFRSWSLDNSDHFPMQVSVKNGGTRELGPAGLVYPHFEVMSNELSTPRILLCPTDEKRTCATAFTSGVTDKNLSYFINLNATNGDRASLLFGDRNITNTAPKESRLVALTKADSLAWTKDLHSKKGNIGFGDASVDLFQNGSPNEVFKIAQGTTNWLAVP
jgi:competence protein ComGC